MSLEQWKAALWLVIGASICSCMKTRSYLNIHNLFDYHHYCCCCCCWLYSLPPKKSKHNFEIVLYSIVRPRTKMLWHNVILWIVFKQVSFFSIFKSIILLPVRFGAKTLLTDDLNHLAVWCCWQTRLGFRWRLNRLSPAAVHGAEFHSTAVGSLNEAFKTHIVPATAYLASLHENQFILKSNFRSFFMFKKKRTCSCFLSWGKTVNS